MDIKLTCPFGSVCSEIKDNKLHRCHLYTEMKGCDAQGNEHDQWRCALAWMPILQVESSSTNRSVAAAIESARNVNDKNQKAAINELKSVGIANDG